MAVYAVTDSDGAIVNRIVLDDPAEWSPPAGCSIELEPASGYDIGGTLIGGTYTAPIQAAAPAPVFPQSILSQDLMAQFTADDAAKIKAAVDGNPQFWLLWSAMQAQKDPMLVTNDRFLTGWNALIQVLGQPRMTQIATALDVSIG